MRRDSEIIILRLAAALTVAWMICLSLMIFWAISGIAPWELVKFYVDAIKEVIG